MNDIGRMTRLNDPTMTPADIAVAMSNGVSFAKELVTKLFNRDSAQTFGQMEVLDNERIFGYSLYRLWCDECQENYGLWDETIQKMAEKQRGRNQAPVQVSSFI